MEARKFTFNGRTLTVNEWAIELNMEPSVIYARIGRGEPLEKALNPDSREKSYSKAKTLTYNGETLTVRQWAERLGMAQRTLQARIAQGLPLEEVLVNRTTTLTHEGKTMKISEWAKLLGIPAQTIRGRYDKGFPMERVLSKTSFTPKLSEKAGKNCSLCLCIDRNSARRFREICDREGITVSAKLRGLILSMIEAESGDA